MTTQQDVPGRYTTVDPWIVSVDTDAEIDFLNAVFAARPRGEPMRNADGSIGHAELAIGDCVVMMFDLPAGSLAPTSALRVNVTDVDQVVRRAEDRGAVVITRPTELAFGDKVARFRDPQGHLWWVHEHLRDLSPEEIGRRFEDPAMTANMVYVQTSLISALTRVAT